LFTVLILIAGFYPAIVLNLIELSSQDWLDQLKS
jgi:hypothetical protein